MKNYPNKDNTAIIIVTYNPDENLLKTALAIHKKIVNTIIIIDNHSENYDNWKHLIDQYNITILSSSENKGIAWALNKGIDIAKENEMEYALTFDQDSIPVSNILKLYAKHYSHEIGLIGTVFTTENCEASEIVVKESLTVITSGCLHNLNACSIVGPYNENLFIDSVDFEYAIRMKISGFKVLRSSVPLLVHNLGNPIKKWGLTTSNHSCLRRYYMSRNHIILTKKFFFKVPIFVIKKNYTFIKEIIKLLLIENNRVIKLKNIIRGLKDGFTNH